MAEIGGIAADEQALAARGVAGGDFDRTFRQAEFLGEKCFDGLVGFAVLGRFLHRDLDGIAVQTAQRRLFGARLRMHLQVQSVLPLADHAGGDGQRFSPARG